MTWPKWLKCTGFCFLFTRFMVVTKTELLKWIAVHTHTMSNTCGHANMFIFSWGKEIQKLGKQSHNSPQRNGRNSGPKVGNAFSPPGCTGVTVGAIGRLCAEHLEWPLGSPRTFRPWTPYENNRKYLQTLSERKPKCEVPHTDKTDIKHLESLLLSRAAAAFPCFCVLSPLRSLFSWCLSWLDMTSTFCSLSNLVDIPVDRHTPANMFYHGVFELSQLQTKSNQFYLHFLPLLLGSNCEG